MRKLTKIEQAHKDMMDARKPSTVGKVKMEFATLNELQDFASKNVTGNWWFADNKYYVYHY